MNERQTARANRLAGEVVMGWEDKQGMFYGVVDWIDMGDDESRVELQIMPVITFCPCSNWEHAGWVWDRLVRLGYSVSLEQLENETPNCVIFPNGKFEEAEYYHGETPQEALVKCALACFGYDADAEVEG